MQNRWFFICFRFFLLLTIIKIYAINSETGLRVYGMFITPFKVEQSLRGMVLQEKEAQKDLKHAGNLFRKNLQLKGVC